MSGSSPQKVPSPDRPLPWSKWRDNGRTRVAVYALLAGWTFLLFFGMFYQPSWLELVPGGISWAIVMGIVISRPIANWVADGLLQLPGPERKDRHPPVHRSMTYPYSLDRVEWKPETVPPEFYSVHSPPISWTTFVAQIAGKLDHAMPSGFTIEAHSLTLVLSDGVGHAPVYLGAALETPPQDPVERALHASLESLWRVQALLVERLGKPWPAGDLSVTASVRFEDGSIRLWYGDAEMPALEIGSIPFDPQPHEIDPAEAVEGSYRTLGTGGMPG